MKISLSNKRVLVTGANGFLGRHVCDRLKEIGVTPIVVSRRQYDLTKLDSIRALFHLTKPQVVIHLAAVCGGIGANRAEPGRFFYENAIMGIQLIEEARKAGIEKFVQVGTVCSYPKHATIPFKEMDLWDGYPEETNAPYGLAKKMLGVQLEAYAAQYSFNSAYLIPVNLYGPGDNFDLNTSHVIPAIIRKMHEAQAKGKDSVTLWGNGEVSREFLYVKDAAEAIVLAANTHPYGFIGPINLGTSFEIKIADLADLIAGLMDWHGNIEWDTKMPNGQPRRCLAISLAEALLGWTAKTPLAVGLMETINYWHGNGDIDEGQ